MRISGKSWFLATDWDDQSVRYVLARQEADQITITAAESISRESAEGSPGEILEGELKKAGVRRPTTIVALARSQAEVIPISLPPAKDDELPQLVAMQLEQLAPEITDRNTLDFIPLNEEDSGPRQVIAIAPRSDVIQSVENELKLAGLKAKQITFRPLGLLPLIDRTNANKSSRALAFCLEPGAADILLLDEGKLVLSRAVRLPNREDPTFANSLIGELRRTAMVLPHDSGGSTELQHVYGFGSGAEFDDLISLLNEDASVSITRVNPFRIVNDEIGEREAVSRFAPLVGAMLFEASPTAQPAIDFLAPRRPPAKPSPWRRVAFYSALCSGLLAACVYFVYDTRHDLNEEIGRLSSELDKVEKMSEKLSRRQRIVDAIGAWQSNDVSWLDELRDLSIRFPGPNDALVQRMTVTPVDGGNLVALQLRVRDPEVVSVMEANLRDAAHSIESKRVSEVAGAEEFGWRLDATILVQPRDEQSYLAYLAMDKDSETPEGEADDDSPAGVSSVSSDAGN